MPVPGDKDPPAGIPVFTPHGGGVIHLMGGLQLEYIVLPQQTGGAYELHEQVIPAGKAVVAHTHRDEDQLSYIVKGSLGVRVGEAEWTASAGDRVFRPRGIKHALWNSGPGEAVMLEASSPGASITEFFGGFDLLTRQGEVSVQAVRRLAAPYGITYDLALTAEIEARHGVSAGGAWFPAAADGARSVPGN